MKRKIVLFCMMLCSVIGLWACSSEPYDKMSIDTSVKDSVIQLNIEQTVKDGQIVYDYDSISFDVTVKSDADLNTGVEVSGGKGFLKTVATPKANGITTITVTPISHLSTGRCSLVVKTLEGNKSVSIDFNIDLKLNNFEFKDNVINVVMKDSTIDLSNVDKILDFYPEQTTQKDVVFELVEMSDGYNINGDSYEYSPEDPFNKYAEIENNVLKTYSTFLDSHGNPVASKYPSRIIGTNSQGNVISKNYIPVRARYNDISKIYAIEVIENCSNISLFMNSQDEGSKDISISKNINGEYDIRLLSQKYQDGFIYPEYFVERELKFDLAPSLNEDLNGGAYNPSDFRVTTTYVTEDAKLPIILSSFAELDNYFRVQSTQEAGIYSHKFRIEHVEYPEVCNTEVIVNFEVVDIPTSATIKATSDGETWKQVDKDNPIKIYDEYKGMDGTKFSVALNNKYGNFDYFVFLKNFAEYDSLHLRSDDEDKIFALYNDQTGEGVVTSAGGDVPYTRFGSRDYFYIRHSFNSLNIDFNAVYIGVEFSVAANSYDAETKKLFNPILISIDLPVEFEFGLKSIDISKSKYYLDITNPSYQAEFIEDEGIITEIPSGLKLFSLPLGQTIDSCLSYITYDEDLITVKEFFDYDTQQYSVYVQCNDELKIGTTRLRILAKNGLSKTIDIETYFPTAYAQNKGITEDSEQYMDLNVAFDITDSDYLGSNNTTDKTCFVYKIDETNNRVQWKENYEYYSRSDIIMLVGGKLPVSIYDFMLITDDNTGMNMVLPIDITSKVYVESSDSLVASYSDGVISAHMITVDNVAPVRFDFIYSATYETVDSEGNIIYDTFPIRKTIYVYIYKSIEGVDVGAVKYKELYLDESLGYNDKSKSLHSIESIIFPQTKYLAPTWEGFNFVTLEYNYEDVLNSYIYDSNGRPFTITSNDGRYTYTLKYSDLFYIEVVGNTCIVKAKIVDINLDATEDDEDIWNLRDWWRYRQDISLEDNIKNIIFANNNIELTISVIARQCNKISTVNSVTISVDYAEKITGISLDVPNDGVYFEIKPDSKKTEYVMNYSLQNDLAINKKIAIFNSTNVCDISGNTNKTSLNGTFKISALKPVNAYIGVEDYITITPEDNIKSINNDGTITYFNNNLVKTVRIKTADGSERYPFEIRNITDFKEMIEDVEKVNNGVNEKYYYYTLTRDVDLSQLGGTQIDILRSDKDFFSLNGKHEYYSYSGFTRDTIITYNKLYNLNINRTIASNTSANLGLFGEISGTAIIQNIDIYDAKVSLTYVGEQVDSTSVINIGLLVGCITGDVQILNSSVRGSIDINSTTGTNIYTSLNVGGMIGCAEKGKISGLPANYIEGLSSSSATANVYISTNNATINTTEVVIGGLIGESNNVKLDNLLVTSTILSRATGKFGGLVGLSNNTEIEKIQVNPYITINTINDNVIVGGFIASAENTKINNSKILFAKTGTLVWEDKTQINVNAYNNVVVGGFVGSSSDSEITYSYIRSFYTEDIAYNDYRGNILVTASSGYVGGLIATHNADGDCIGNSYFDGDIVSNIPTGLITGNLSYSVRIEDSYAKGRLYTISSTAVTEISSLNETNMRDMLLGGAELSTNTTGILNNVGYGKSYVNMIINRVYGIVNGKNYYITDTNSICGIVTDDTLYNFLGKTVTIPDIFNSLDFNITDGNDSNPEEFVWFIHNSANMVKGEAFPLLLNTGKVMYDLVPTGIISTIKGNSSTAYNISSGTNSQILLFLNKTENSTSNQEYIISLKRLGDNRAVIEILCEGTSIDTTYIDLPINDTIEISENSFEQVIKIVNGKIVPVSVGTATITINSFIDKTIKTTIFVRVDYGMTGINVFNVENNTTSLIDDDSVIGGTKPILYIDETSYYQIMPYNNGNISNKNIGYIVEILSGTLNINNRQYTYNDSDTDVVVLNDSLVAILGVEIGEAKIKVTPFINLGTLKYNFTDNYNTISLNNALVLDSMSKTYTFVVTGRAQSIVNSISESSLSPDKYISGATITIITPNVEISGQNVIVNETLLLSFGNLINIPFNLNTYTFNTNALTHINSNNTIGNMYNAEELIYIQFSSVEPVIADSKYASCYVITINYRIYFNKNLYRQSPGQYILDEVEYDLDVAIESNLNIEASTYKLTINTETLNNVFTNFYTKSEGAVLEYLGDDNYNITHPEENSSVFVVPGRRGLLKITLKEEWSNSRYVTVTVPKAYEGYVTLTQMAGVATPTSDGILSISSYREMNEVSKIYNDATFGLRLTKMTLNFQEETYFNSTYYVAVDLSKAYGNLTDINITIDSFILNDEGVYESKYNQLVSLKVAEIPVINATIEEEDENVVLGKGIKKQIDIQHKGIVNYISYDIYNNNTNTRAENVFIVDENGIEMNGLLSIDYLKTGKYFICADVSENPGSSYSLKLWAEEYIYGMLERSEQNININIVEFEIVDVDLCNEENTITIKHGESKYITSNITYRDIVVGDFQAIKEYKESLDKVFNSANNANFGRKEILQNMIIGNGISEHSANGVEILSNYTNLSPTLAIKTLNGLDIVYEQLKVKDYTNIAVFADSINWEGGFAFTFVGMRGTAISSDTVIRLRIQYYFNENGEIVIHNPNISSIGREIKTFEIEKYYNIVVKDNSTYDHPNPVETREDLIKAANSIGGHFILVNNINLGTWTPIDASFDSLDGNGYVISINEFNLSGFRGNSEANVGIFSTIAENSLLKNITVDVQGLLKSESQVLEDNANLKKYTDTNYAYSTNIDLAFTTKINFGILAGKNNGAITNAKIINTKSPSTTKNDYVHILTSQGYINNTLIDAKIGGLVGVNETTGAITNSFVGTSVTTADSTKDTINLVSSPSVSSYQNITDEPRQVEIYSFNLSGANNVSGLACINNGVISNSYTRNLGVFNSYSIVNSSKTAGLVVTNNNRINGTFVEADKDNAHCIIEGVGNVGGLVYENNANALVQNSYTDITIETQNAYAGGFVFVNNQNGKISNCYSTAIGKNSLAVGQFTGVVKREVQNFGIYENAYYLVPDETKVANVKEPAQAHVGDKLDSWVGFSFVMNSSNNDGIWLWREGKNPVINATQTDTNSFRVLTGINEDEVSHVVTYNYEYKFYNLGSEENPLIVDKANNFDKYIIDNCSYIEGCGYVFGASQGSGDYTIQEQRSVVRYVRIVNNLDFADIPTAVQYNGTYIYKTTFAGVLDGNGLEINNLNLTTDSTQLETFGLFGQVGLDTVISKKPAVVKNLDINLSSYKSGASQYAGVLAGKVVNASILNVTINGNGIIVSGRNFAGGIAGLIVAEKGNESNVAGKVTLVDVVVENIGIEATYSSLGGEITEYTEDQSENKNYTEFSVKNNENLSEMKAFTSLKEDLSNANRVSYAGGIAGAILVNNYDRSNVGRSDNSDSDINNLVVRGNITISTADNSGGVFGFVGSNTRVKNARFILNDNQLIKAFRYAGGVVGEHYGMLEKSSISYDDEKQSQIDATLSSDQRATNSSILFDMKASQYYTVVIGGIVGYSKDAGIIDSYSKVDVIKERAYIAGGIVGYAENELVLTNVYTTGVVFAQDVIGGIVGFYYSSEKTSSPQALFTNVLSLVNWNASSTDIDYRSIISRRLYDKQSVLYDNNYFYIKLPEIGNREIVGVDTIYNKKLAKTNHFIGSVIGKEIIINSGKAISYDSSNNVVSSTLGIYYETGVAGSQNKDDKYFDSSCRFTLTLNQSESMEVYSYRTAYPVGINSITDNVDPYINDIDYYENVTNYYDNYYFEQVFTAQEYTQQILGTYWRKVTIDTVDTSRPTYNLFNYMYEEEGRVSGVLPNNPDVSFVNPTDLVWQIPVGGLVPNLVIGVASAQASTISNLVDLENSYASTSKGKIYYIDNNIEVTKNNQSPIVYTNSINSSYVGREVKNGEVVISNRPTITFNLTDVNTIFGQLSNASFTNIDFVINVQPTYGNELTSVYGLFANNVIGTTFNNCTIKLVLNGEYNLTGIPNAINVGVLFGYVADSIFANNTIDIIASDININSSKVQNFGLIAGYIDDSIVKVNNIKVATTNMSVVATANNANIGGLFGLVNTTKLLDNVMTQQFVNNITNSVNINRVDAEGKPISTSINIGGVVGSVSNSSIQGDFDIKLTLDDKSNIETLNNGLITGYSTNTRLEKINLEGSLELKQTGASSNTISNTNIGGFVGFDKVNTIVGDRGVVKNTANINVTIKSDILSVGSIIGMSYSANKIINNVVSEGNIVVNNNNSNGFVNLGGVLGCSYSNSGEKETLGSLEIDSVYVNGSISLSGDAIGYLGGIVGFSDKILQISNFVSLGNLNMTADIDRDKKSYISGVVGYSDKLIIVNNGYSYVQLPDKEYVITSSIAPDKISVESDNVYYCQEFVGNNYNIDSNFVSYGMGDLYETISEFSNIYELLAIGFDCKTLGLMQFAVPEILVEFISDLESTWADTNNKFNPNVLSENEELFETYNVIISDIEIVSWTPKILDSGKIISGRTLDNHKTTLSYNLAQKEILTYLIQTNNGIISNINLDINSNDDDAQCIALTYTNNGLITNVSVSGMTLNSYVFAYENKGGIYQSVSNVIYNGSPELYGFVVINSGKIYHSINRSYGSDEDYEDKINLYAFAGINSANSIIDYAYCDIPSGMTQFNTIIAPTSESGAITKIQNTKPKASHIFTYYESQIDENNIMGYTSIKGIMLVENPWYIQINKTILGDGILYTYEFVKENPGYNVVLIKDDLDYYEFMEYGIRKHIDGSKMMPINTYLLIVNDINLDAEKINKFGSIDYIPESSAIIGVKDRNYTGFDINNNIVIEINGDLSISLIKDNYGVISGITFRNLNVAYDGSNSVYVGNGKTSYALIRNNGGVIQLLNLDNYKIVTENVSEICIIAYTNMESGKIINCKATVLGTIRYKDNKQHNVMVYNCSKTSNGIISSLDINTDGIKPYRQSIIITFVTNA